MDMDDLRAIRATVVIAREDARDLMQAMGKGVQVREGFADRVIREMDAVLPVVTDEEALAALRE